MLRIHYRENPAFRAAVHRGLVRSLYRAAGYVRTVARRSIRRRSKSGKPAPLGKPPKSPTGDLKRAILFYVDRERTTAIVGPDAQQVGDVGAAHEFGGRYKGQHYPRRPFMSPALRQSLHVIPQQFRGLLD